MPAHYFYLNAPALLVTTYWGRTDTRVSQRVRAARAADPARALAKGHLIDLTHLEETTGSVQSEADTFRALATSYATIFGPLPTVILATAPHIVGMARIFQIAAGIQHPPVPVLVTGVVADAATFLGLDLTHVMEEIAHVQDSGFE